MVKMQSGTKQVRLEMELSEMSSSSSKKTDVSGDCVHGLVSGQRN